MITIDEGRRGEMGYLTVEQSVKLRELGVFTDRNRQVEGGIWLPDLDDLLDEIERRGWEWIISSDKTCCYVEICEPHGDLGIQMGDGYGDDRLEAVYNALVAAMTAGEATDHICDIDSDDNNRCAVCGKEDCDQ